MPATYEPIATTTLGSTATSITFSSIASSWTDLRLVIVGISGTSTNIALRFNSDTGSNYSRIRLIGNGSAASSTIASNDTEIDLNRENLSTTIPSLYTVDIFSYAGSTNKTLLASVNEDRNGSGSVISVVGMWRNASAITTILITTLSGDTFGIGTTATLYGIKNA
jgi:hypothetical protein